MGLHGHLLELRWCSFCMFIVFLIGLQVLTSHDLDLCLLGRLHGLA